MRFVIINHYTKEIEFFDNVKDMIFRIDEINHTTDCKPTHLAVDLTGITIIMDSEFNTEREEY